MKAFILAGGKGNKSELDGYKNKALIPIGEKVMLEYIIDALRESAYIDGFAIIGDTEELKDSISLERPKEVFLSQADSMIDNVVKGLTYFQGEDRVFIITSDIPFITPMAIDHFIKASLESKGDLAYPIISKENQMKAFPEMQRTYVKLKEGTFTGGNMFVVNPSITQRCVSMAKYMIENRKKPWKMIKILGFGFLLQLLTGTLRLEKLEKRVAHLLDIYPKAVISPYAEVGNDIAKPSDLEFARKYFMVEEGGKGRAL